MAFRTIARNRKGGIVQETSPQGFGYGQGGGQFFDSMDDDEVFRIRKEPRERVLARSYTRNTLVGDDGGGGDDEGFGLATTTSVGYGMAPTLRDGVGKGKGSARGSLAGDNEFGEFEVEGVGNPLFPEPGTVGGEVLEAYQSITEDGGQLTLTRYQSYMQDTWMPHNDAVGHSSDMMLASGHVFDSLSLDHGAEMDWDTFQTFHPKAKKVTESRIAADELFHTIDAEDSGTVSFEGYMRHTAPDDEVGACTYSPANVMCAEA